MPASSKRKIDHLPRNEALYGISGTTVSLGKPPVFGVASRQVIANRTRGRLSYVRMSPLRPDASSTRNAISR